ncbi:MAG TPA: TonB-dependent receptor [Casimicrobiaceae bacterium]|nr:TonB-dependent receptor [Casimicrobiaceae bacterium]
MPTPAFPRRARHLLGAVALVPATTLAQADPAPPPAQLAPVVVTAARLPQPLDRLTADVTVIDAEEIARSGAQGLAELLQRQPGVEITQNGGPGGTSGVFLRGANRGQTVLLVDGMRVASATVGAPSFEAVPLDQIERIEILRGPASSLYGADAIGGVVQVFTKKASGPSLELGAGYGTHATRALSAGGSVVLGALRLGVQAGGRRSDGFDATTDRASAFARNPDRDGYETESVSAHAALELARGHELSASVLRNRLDAQFDGGPGFDDRTLTTLDVWQAGSRNRITDAWTSRLTVGETRDDSVSRTALGDFGFLTRQRQLQWQHDVAIPMGTLSLAYERREESVDEDAGFAVTTRRTNAVVGVWQLRHEDHALQANLRRDDSSQYGGRTTGALAWGWRFAPEWRLTAGYGTAFKAPSFNDLYYPGFSNPELVPERSRNVDASLRWARTQGDWRLAAGVTAWHNEVRDLIVFQCDAAFNCLPRNVSSATLAGATLTADAAWQRTTVKLSLDVQDPQDDATGHQLPRRARRHGVLAVGHAIGSVRLGAELVAASRRYDDAENVRAMGGYGIVNLTAEWSAGKGVSVLARVDNVGGKDYELAAGYATGGARGFAGVRWQP